ncbi:DUF3696 domain-containing protein [Planomonospora sp. ID82291]|uniref:DUF3696 domain-containing protein n=1 Tax=Planomonospora sp. ID82291 TaxID=2738136 RepID=UPI0018C42814|nr:DUF3696 domain-containing protein [Planomonospora sp. ID82291]MBG0813847.1 DUF3696 domain-containing protein [Planomonospora sp. ID82291]
MGLLRMAVENYRCFKERQEIELRPITIILGKNNSGKSALTRLPLLLETGVRTDSTLPLDLEALGDDPPDYLDLVYGRNVHRALRFEFVVGGPGRAIEIKATIQNIAERQIQFVRELRVADGGRSLRLEWLAEDAGRSYSMTLRSRPPVEMKIRFRGLIPVVTDRSGTDPDHIDWLAGLEYDVRRCFGEIQYLSAYRQRPSRLIRLPSRIAADVGSVGENAAGMLVNDHVRGERVLLDQVNRLLGDSLAGWRLEIEQQGPMYAVNLRSLTNPELSVNLLDSGTGVAQVLPLLVQRAYDTVNRKALRQGTLHVIEEPELHLHPAFHALLADLFIAGAQQQTGRFLIETHSETMLLRIRRRIAEGRIPPDDVAVYFVDHDAGSSWVRRIGIDRLGNLDYWPSGVFSEDFEETKKLAEAQFARECHEG